MAEDHDRGRKGTRSVFASARFPTCRAAGVNADRSRGPELIPEEDKNVFYSVLPPRRTDVLWKNRL